MSDELPSFGDQGLPGSTLWLQATSALLGAAALGVQFGWPVGLAVAVAGLWSVRVTAGWAGLPRISVQRDGLVLHLGRRQRIYPWTELGRRTKLRRLHWQWYLECPRKRTRPVLLPLAGLEAEERQQLAEIVAAVLADVHAAHIAPA